MPSPHRRSPLLGLVVAGLVSAGCAAPMGSIGKGSIGPTTPQQGLTTQARPAPGGSAATPPPSPGQLPDANMDRAAIPDRYKWKLDVLFASDQAFEQGMKDVAERQKELGAYAGKLGKPAELRACLERYFEARLATNKLTLYANLRFDSAQKSNELQGMNDRAQAAMQELMRAASFIRREVLLLDDAALAAAYRAEPKLAGYKPYLEELRRRQKRVLGPDAERALALLGDNLWAEIDLNELTADVERIYKSARADLVLPKITDEAGKEVQLTLANYGKYRGSTDRRVRRDTVEAFFGALRGAENTFAATLAGQMKLDVGFARARGYDTALAAYLDKDDIDPGVYHGMVKALHANVAPLHRYVKLRKQLMGLDELHIYDLYGPMFEGSKRQFGYDEAVRILPEALAPLGDAYVAELRRGLDPAQGWIDVYPHKDKDSGAFSVNVYGVHPFLKMNYQDDAEDLSTLAHEYGHAIHSALAMKAQPYVTAGYVPFIAEIASTLNEKLLSDYLFAHAKDDDERLSILNRLVESIRTTIYRQAMFAEFELRAHTAVEAGTALTAEWLDAQYGELLRTYYGPDLTLGQNDAVEWAYIPHFYYKYYLYAYATGLASGIALADKVQKEGAPARDAYLGMLKGGSSKPPLELLRGAGVDLTKPDAIEAAARLLDRTLGQIEEILARRAGATKTP
ncbi:MAG: oligoendopeptidase F [Myxococcales bacterium]|nr:oligoendopeptidase F [Myxococcales bacterium]